MKSSSIGYGAGSRDHAGLPNLLRATIGDAQDTRPGLEPLVMIETNVDDMNPQLCGYFGEQAFRAGALDVFFTSVQMKKGRPGLVISVLCRPDDRDRLMDLFFEETTTIGVRCSEVFRRALERDAVSVTTRFGDVRVKVARQGGSVLNFAPEYDDCRRLAEANNVPLREVLQEAAFVFLSSGRS